MKDNTLKQSKPRAIDNIECSEGWWTTNKQIVKQLGIGIVIGFVAIGGGYMLVNAVQKE